MFSWQMLKLCSRPSKKCIHTFPKVSRVFPAGTLDSARSDGCKSQKLMLSNNLIYGAAPGTFHLLPYTTRVLEKLYRVIDYAMQDVGGQKITMPCLSSGTLWKTSGRWDDMGSELLSLQDRHDIDHCLAPTHEEAVTSLVAAEAPISYKRLPIKLYQIGRKFRDEMRPKNGLLRCREFEMKDMYSFDLNDVSAQETYDQVCDAYESIFNQLGLQFVKVEGDTGVMGGSRSNEYHVLSSVGEDKLAACETCGRAFNKEVLAIDTSFHCPVADCTQTFEQSSGIEVAHAFLLGTKYSKIFKAVYTDQNQKKGFLYMGCYGIGVTRLIAASVETLSTDDAILWPRLIAPYQICIIPQKEGFQFEKTFNMAEDLQKRLSEHSNLKGEVILDDRTSLSIGRRLKDAKVKGYPYAIAVGKKALDSLPLYEFSDLYGGETEYLSQDAIIDKLCHIPTIPL